MLLLIAAMLLVAKGYWNATRDPIIRHADITVADWPENAPPLRVLLISDVHVAGPDMTPERLRTIIARLNRLKPDMVAIAGDLISEKRIATRLYTPAQIAALLGEFKSPLGTIIALGNHDNWTDPIAFKRELAANGIIVLENQAVQRGPLIIGGVGDDFSDHDDVPTTFAEMAKLGNGPQIVLTHSPDIIPDLPHPVAAVLAGHTHCGQIVIPYYGPVSFVSRYKNRFGCGDITDEGQRVIVGAGLGTSVLWLRYGAPPDVWMLRFRGAE